MGNNYSNKTFRPSKVKKLAKGQDNVCIYCGEKLTTGNSSIEHIVPQAVFKRTETIFHEKSRMSKLCHSDGNLAVVHRECNARRNSKLLADKAINNLCLPENKKSAYKKYVERCSKYIEAYSSLVNRIVKKQGGKCGICGSGIAVNTATIRRIDNKKPRTEDNAVAICPKCNYRISKRKGGILVETKEKERKEIHYEKSSNR